MMKVLCTRVAKCESGATAMEYALTATIISVALLTGADTLGNSLSNKFTSLSKKLVIASQEDGRPDGGTSLGPTRDPAHGLYLATSTQSR